MQKLLPTLFIAAFLIVALFGVYLTVPTSHGMHCPFASGCVTAIEHLSHWQDAFTTVLLEVTVLAAAFFVVIQYASVATATNTIRLRRLSHVPSRPTLLQELFSRGILNRKEDHYA